MSKKEKSELQKLQEFKENYYYELKELLEQREKKAKKLSNDFDKLIGCYSCVYGTTENKKEITTFSEGEKLTGELISDIGIYFLSKKKINELTKKIDKKFELKMTSIRQYSVDEYSYLNNFFEKLNLKFKPNKDELEIISDFISDFKKYIHLNLKIINIFSNLSRLNNHLLNKKIGLRLRLDDFKDILDISKEVDFFISFEEYLESVEKTLEEREFKKEQIKFNKILAIGVIGALSYYIFEILFKILTSDPQKLYATSFIIFCLIIGLHYTISLFFEKNNFTHKDYLNSNKAFVVIFFIVAISIAFYAHMGDYQIYSETDALDNLSNQIENNSNNISSAITELNTSSNQEQVILLCQDDNLENCRRIE